MRIGSSIAVLASLAASGLAQAQTSQFERGAYIVNNVAMCGDCHTPHGPNGPIAGQTLAGAPLPFAPLHPMPWADRTPRLAGLPAGYTQADLAHLLQTGKRPNGAEPRPPMPAYRMNERDAKAVAAYIASLKP